MTPFAQGRWINTKTGKRWEPLRTRDGRLILGVKPNNEKELKAWRKLVAITAGDATPSGFETIDVDVNLAAEFVFDRNKGDMGTGRNASIVKASASPFPTTGSQGDLSKLVRAVEDSLTDAKVWRDDKLVVSYNGTRKRWGVIPESCGVHIAVTPALEPVEGIVVPDGQLSLTASDE